MDSKSGWDLVKTHIAMALGSFGAALAGTPNFAMQRIKDEQDEYNANQKDKIDKKFQLARAAAERVKGTRKKGKRDRAVRNIDEQEALPLPMPR